MAPTYPKKWVDEGLESWLKQYSSCLANMKLNSNPSTEKKGGWGLIR
jgi:hypothetical protein